MTNEFFLQIFRLPNLAKRNVLVRHTDRRRTMKCSCCHIDTQNLREYECSSETADHRKTIATYYLCVLCRMLFAFKPDQVVARCRGERIERLPAVLPRFAARRAA